MANWQRTLDIAAEWELAEDRAITAKKLASIISTKLEALPSFDAGKYPNSRENVNWVNMKKDDMASDFKSFSEDESELTFDDLDDLIKELYDWGDIALDQKFGGKKVCWIKVH